MKNNLKWMPSRAEVLAKVGAPIGLPTEEKIRWGLVCRAPALRGHSANPNLHGVRRQACRRSSTARRRLRLEPRLPSYRRHCRRSALPAQSKTSNHCLYRYQAPSDRIKVKNMQKMPIFQVEPTETNRNYFHAMETSTASAITPTTTPCGLLASNHKPAKNGRNKTKSKRIRVLKIPPFRSPLSVNFPLNHWRRGAGGTDLSLSSIEKDQTRSPAKSSPLLSSYNVFRSNRFC